MLRRTPRQPAVRLFLGLILAMAILLPPGVANAQVQQGATLTILRGQVALLRASGTAVQPAPSGSTVGVGDEIRTIAKSGALITFFSGTEIEMGEETILVVDQLNRQGDKIDVSLRQVLGTTVNRVQSLTETGSSYSIQAGGAVAVVRGTTFALVGPVTTPAGNVVAMACREDCSPTSTFNGCNMAAFTGYGVSSSNGKVDSGCYTFHVDRADSAADAAHYGVTTVEQALQGDTKTVPAGQIPGGSKQEKGARFDELEREAKQKDLPKDQQVSQQTVQAVQSVAPLQDPPLSPSPPGTRPCNTNVVGGGGVTTTVYELGRTSGSFTFTYQAFSVPDRFQVIYQGVTLLDTGLVSGAATPTLTYSGTATFVTVVVTGSAAGTGTSWDATVGCPF